MVKDEVNFSNKAISKSIFRGKNYPKNNLSLSIIKGKANTLYVYHQFGKKRAYDRFRWYDTNFGGENNFKLDSKNRILHYVVPYWEDEGADGAFYADEDVPVKIYFTPYGWKKFNKTIALFQEKIDARKKRISKKRKAPAKKKTTTRKRKAPAKKKTTTRKRKAPAKKKTTTRKRKAPAKKKTTTRKRKAPVKKRKATKKKTTRKKR